MSRAEKRAQDSEERTTRRRRADSAQESAEQDLAAGRSRHSTGLGEDFSTIVGWTTAGTFIPGSGLLRAGKRKRGLVILLGFFGGIAAIFAFLLWRGPVSFVSRLGTSPDYLLGIAVVAALGALIWILVILGTFNALRSPTILTRGQKALSGVMVTSLVIIVGVPLGVTTYYSLVQRQTIVDVFGSATGASVAAEDLWADTDRVNVMLMGQDNGAGRTGVRPDTMLVASIVPATGDATLISIPRNLNMPIFPEGSPLEDRFPSGFNAFGMEESLINAVWTWADSEPDAVAAPEGMAPGMWATMQAVEGSLGLKLDYYAAIDMEGFEDLIDAIGGVDIDVERPIPMGGGTNMRTGLPNKINGYIDPGAQKLDGKRALWYVRSREGADNYDRMCRQQKMLKLTLDQIDPQEIALAYPQLAGSASRNITTDIPQNEFGAFVELAERMRKGTVDSAQINNDVVTTYNPDYDVLHTWVQEQLEAPEDDAPETAEDQDGGSGDSGDSGESNDSGDSSDASGDSGEGSGSGGDAAASGDDAEQKTEDGVWCLPQGYSEDKVWRDYTPGGQ